MIHAYDEIQLIEQPAPRLLAELGWGMAVATGGVGAPLGQFRLTGKSPRLI